MPRANARSSPLRPQACQAHLAQQVVDFVQRLRGEELFKLPGVAETIDWAQALTYLNKTELTAGDVDETLGVLLKYQDDIAKVRGAEAARLGDGGRRRGLWLEDYKWKAPRRDAGLKCFFNALAIPYTPVMPFDVLDFPDASRMDRAATRQNRRLVAMWLFTVAAMIMVMIVLGGATRLTGSGLSIMEWAPIMGALPPNQRRGVAPAVRAVPENPAVHVGQRRFWPLAGFKHIFWLEWTHRLWGRLIGVVFLLPMLFLWATARIERHLLPWLGLLFILGALQGAVGWFMVASGFLPDTTAVSPYRLVIHLALSH